jgi:two-component system, NarL family, response regulator LiaR
MDPAARLSVMLVDDESSFVAAATRMFDLDGGVQVVAGASSGPEAISLLDGGPVPDLVLVDVQMPGRDGFETTRDLLARHPGLQVVLISSEAEDAYTEMSAEVGAVGFLPKRDLSPERLLGLVKPSPATRR